MTVPKWLIPVISIVAALAVGAAATLLGMRFAPTASTTPVAADAPVVAPVLSPIGVGGGEPPAESPVGDGGTAPEPEEGEAPILVSTPAGEREIVPPLEADVDDPWFREYLRLVGAEPEFRFPILDALVGARGDRCARGDGAVPEGCPAGLPGALLAGGELPYFVAVGQAFPPTREEFEASGNPRNTSLWCDGAVRTDQASFGVQSSLPGVFTVRYWAIDDPADVRSATFETDDAEAAAWAARADAGDAYARVRTCGILEGLDAETAYLAVVTGVDGYGRRSEAHTSRFHSDGAPVNPGLQLATVGDNLVFAAAYAPRDQVVDIRMATVPLGTEATCDVATDTARARPLATSTLDLDEDAVAAVNAPTDHRQKNVAAYLMEEGTTAVFCARWFPAGDAPSWVSTQSIYESVVVVQAPDKLVPVLRWTSVDGADDEITEITARVSSAEGIDCGRPSWRPEEAGILPRSACAGSLLAGGGTTNDAGRISTRPFGGDLVVALTAQSATGPVSETVSVIPAGAGACRGVCDLPERTWFRVALTDVDLVTGLCGSLFDADCTPPTRSVVAGTATFSLDWEQGRTNGAADWNISVNADRTVDTVVPDIPQLDMSAPAGGWTFGTPTTSTPWTYGDLRVRVDRPVDFELALLDVRDRDEAAGEAVASCSDGSPLVRRGSSESSSGQHVLRARLSGLCLATSYAVRLTMTDADGATSVWTIWEGPGATWEGAYIVTPGLVGTGSVTLNAVNNFGEAHASARVTINGVDVLPALENPESCLLDGRLTASAITPEIPLRSVNTVVVRLQINQSHIPYTGDAEAWRAWCQTATRAAPGPFVEITSEQTLAQLMGGIRITSPESYQLDMRLFVGDVVPDATP